MFFAFERNILVVLFIFLVHLVCVGQEAPLVDGRDNNTYKTVKIGKQIWMAENLRYLPSVNQPENISYENMFNPMYYVYGYVGTDATEAKETEEYKIYGVLYNQAAAKKACPIGWRLPRDSDWNSLEKAFGMDGSAIRDIGNRGKNEGVSMAGDTALWSVKGKVDFKKHMSDKSDFMVLPAGYVGIDRKYHDIGGKASFWSSSEYCDGFSYYRSIGVNSFGVYRNNSDNTSGMSVRCVKN